MTALPVASLIISAACIQGDSGVVPAHAMDHHVAGTVDLGGSAIQQAPGAFTIQICRTWAA
jgi:hypothetical protein